MGDSGAMQVNNAAPLRVSCPEIEKQVKAVFGTNAQILAKKQHVVTHEFGHRLTLRHPLRVFPAAVGARLSPNQGVVDSVMVGGRRRVRATVQTRTVFYVKANRLTDLTKPLDFWIRFKGTDTRLLLRHDATIGTVRRKQIVANPRTEEHLTTIRYRLQFTNAQVPLVRALLNGTAQGFVRQRLAPPELMQGNSVIVQPPVNVPDTRKAQIQSKAARALQPLEEEVSGETPTIR
jgi:hypothetical protein